METFQHTPGHRDFLIEEKDVSVTKFRRKPSAVWQYLETPGHIIFFTRRKVHVAVLMSIEAYACLSNDYEAEMRKVEEAACANREEKKAARRRCSRNEQTDM